MQARTNFNNRIQGFKMILIGPEKLAKYYASKFIFQAMTNKRFFIDAGRNREMVYQRGHARSKEVCAFIKERI